MKCKPLFPILAITTCIALYGYHKNNDEGPGLAAFASEVKLDAQTKWARHDVERHAPDDGERMIDRSFQVRAGGELAVQVSDADVRVVTGAAGDARVEVFLNGRNMERARRYFEALHFNVSQDGDRITVTHGKVDHHLFSNDRDGGADILVVAHVPRQFNAGLKTSDGDITVGDLTGRLLSHTSDGDIHVADVDGAVVELKTSDGDIRAGALRSDEITVQSSDGDIHVKEAAGDRVSIRTSDGDLMAERIQGDLEAVTSDGDIRLGSLTGATLRIRTSDGDISIEGISAEGAEVVTSDGNIRLERVDGPLQASTSSGNVHVTLLKAADMRLRSTDGDIFVSAPGTLPANVRLHGDGVQISSAYAFSGDRREDRAEGQINGGGPVLDASTSDGTVRLQAE